MKRISALLLALLLSLTSVTIAVAHAQSAGAIQLELCDAHGGTTTVTLDAAGNPIANPHHCPDCLAATAAPDGAPQAGPLRPQTRGKRQVCLLPLPLEDAVSPEPVARGPPALL